MAVPAVILAQAAIAELDLSVIMRIRVNPGGTWRIVELLVTPLSAGGLQHDMVTNPPGAVTVRALRGLRLDAIARQAVAQEELPVVSRADVRAGAFQVEGRELTYLADPRMSRSDLVEAAARAYNQAVVAGSRAPVQAVMAALGYSRGHASRFIREARDSGAIPPSERPRTRLGQAGRK
jgi:hypothetical protein